MKGLAALVTTIVLAACATATIDAMSGLTGTYTHRFRNGTVEGEGYWSEDRIDIARINATHAAVSIGLDFFNGHSCSLSGDATLEDGVLILPAPPEDDGLPGCALRIERAGDAIILHDPENGCMMHHCGMRGSFEGAQIAYASRQPPPSVWRIRHPPNEP